MLLEHLFQLRAMEGIRRRLAHAYVRCLNMKATGKLPCVRSELEVTRLRFVLDEDHHPAGGTSLRRHLVDSANNLRRVEGLMRSFAKALLDVNNK